MQTTLGEVCSTTGWPVGHAYLVAPDAQALAQGLARMADDCELRARLGAAARRRALQRHSLDAFREKVRFAYQSLQPAPASQ